MWVFKVKKFNYILKCQVDMCNLRAKFGESGDNFKPGFRQNIFKIPAVWG